jgi:hypothetical protein
MKSIKSASYCINLDVQISSGLDLAKRYGVPSPVTEHVAKIYDEAMEKFGKLEGSTIPIKLNEVASGVKLAEGKGSAKDHFDPWSYTTEIRDGSFQVVHNSMDNPYLKEPFTTHADVKI